MFGNLAIYRVIRPFTLALACLASLAASPCAHAAGERAQDYRGGRTQDIVCGEMNLRFYGVELTSGSTGVVARAGGKVLFRAEAAFGGYDLGQAQVLRDFPARGATTLLVSVGNGGSCCTETHILTRGDTGMAYAGVTSNRSRAGAEQRADDPAGALFCHDGFFANYYVSDGKADIIMYPGSHAAVERFLVFDNGHWRADRPGEFRERYLALADADMRACADPAGYLRAQPGLRAVPGDQLREMAGEVRLCKAVEAAYHAMMAGESAEQCLARLNAALPPSHSLLAPKVLADVRKAVAGFNPVERRRI
uniref:Uncharacterized protein n=1 Tax=Fundidesulfovibrio putealis TaxID=270496 RepID=A0A7C4AGS0_9BACT